MLNSYDDACSMNETHVFYSSTNTFRNPIFEPQIDYNDPSTCQDNKTGSSNNEALQQETCPNQQTNEETNSDQEHNFDGNKHVTFGWSHSNLNKLWQEFCEDLSYLISYRFFILEFNIKRHARIVRKYLDQRLSWIRPLIGQRNKCHNLRRRDRYDWNDEPSFDHLNKKHQIRQHEPSFAKGSKIAASLGDFQFPEPKSAKHLSTQRECLVKRLEQIKRHRLFDLESQFIASPEEQANNLSDYIDSLDDLNEYAGCRPTSAKKDPSEATNNVTSTELTSQILHQQDQSNLKQSSSFELVNDQLQMNISTTKSMVSKMKLQNPHSKPLCFFS